ncbi:MAG: hypothetical protein MRJ52_06995 [Nitrosomonas sp.]|nr:hypothetical protein [Nitrosomonas sp.]
MIIVSSLGSANNDLNESDGGGQFAAGPDLSLSSVNVNTDQFSPDQLWSISGSGGSVSTLIIELAGSPIAHSVFMTRLILRIAFNFGGSAGLGELVTLSILLNGDVEVTNSGGTSILGNFASNHRLLSDVAAQNNRWFSEIAGNTDGEDHMVAYQGDGSDIL